MTAFTDCCAPGLSGTVSELMLVHSQDGIAQQVRNPPATEEIQESSFDPWVGKIPWRRKMATHSSTCAWTIPWTEEPGRLQSIGWKRVGHDWAHSQDEPTCFTCLSFHTPGLGFHQPSVPALSRVPFYFQHWLMLPILLIGAFPLLSARFSTPSKHPASLASLLQGQSFHPSLFAWLYIAISPLRNALLYKVNHVEML